MWGKLPPEVQKFLCPPSNGTIDQPRQLPRRSKPDWEEYIREIKQYRELADDYDGQGAIAPSSDAIESAIALARGLAGAGIAVPTYAVAGPNGTIDLAWDFEGGVSVSVEVLDSCQADVFLLAPGQPRHWVLNHTVVV